MALLLNIDTSTSHASISVAENAQSLHFLSNSTQKDHAAWIQVAIKEALEKSGRSLHELNAIAVTAGPGSYTGLRVGMATAKGLCYALNLPLIAINTLEAMAFSVSGTDVDYICPMVDARRMEVFTALYDKKQHTIVPPCALVLEAHHFEEYLNRGKVLFFGDGSPKWKEVQHHKNAVFGETDFHADKMVKLSHERFLAGDFAGLAYVEPIYIKDFYMPGFKG